MRRPSVATTVLALIAGIPTVGLSGLVLWVGGLDHLLHGRPAAEGWPMVFTLIRLPLVIATLVGIVLMFTRRYAGAVLLAAGTGLQLVIFLVEQFRVGWFDWRGTTELVIWCCYLGLGLLTVLFAVLPPTRRYLTARRPPFTSPYPPPGYPPASPPVPPGGYPPRLP